MQSYWMRWRVGVSAVLYVLGGAASAVATANESAPAKERPATEQRETAKGEAIEEIVVTAHPLAEAGLSQAVIVLDSDALEREQATNIGATLARQPGIHSASFGEAVGQPVIQGMSGSRVRVMVDGIDTMDAAASSGDHAVMVDPLVANRVEVLKGPSTLLYGSGAIGGVIAVRADRIPREATDGLTGRITARGVDNGGGTGMAARLDGGGNGFAWHVDGFQRSADDYDIPGFAESARVRLAEAHEEHEEEEEHHEEDHEDEDEHEDEHAFGTLRNSHSDASGGAFGFSAIGKRGFIGFSASGLNYDYGLPGHTHAHAHEEEHEEHDEHEEVGEEHEDEEHEGEEHEEEETVILQLKQNRIDFETGLRNPFPRMQFLNVRFGRNDYDHIEFENSGSGTRIAIKSYEGRVELVEDNDRGFDQTVGAQFNSRDYTATGEEVFVPPVNTNSAGVFWVGERPVGDFDIEAGARWESLRHEPSIGAARRFNVHSLSVGLVTDLAGGRIGLHSSLSTRAPSAEELYSNGPHLATGSYDLGDPDLHPERALYGSITWNWDGPRLAVTATAYATAFRNHIYGAATGATEDHLPVYQYLQHDAVYRGVELSTRYAAGEFQGVSLAVSGMFDAVAAQLDRVGNDVVPRLPPSRFGVGLHARRGRVNADIEWFHALAQNETAPNELPTNSYDDLRLRIATELPTAVGDVRLFLQGRNLTDDEQRHHTSIVKDQAPAPGRAWEVGVSMAF